MPRGDVTEVLVRWATRSAARFSAGAQRYRLLGSSAAVAGCIGAPRFLGRTHGP